MRSYNSTYLGYHEQSTTEPRFTVRIDFATDFTQSVYFTSHSDAATPGGATVVSSVLLGGVTVSQRLGDISSIGNMTLRFADVDSTVSAQFSGKLDSGYGLRLKRIRIYKGFKDLTWANYETLQTQAIGSLSYKDGVYTITGQDVQRIAKNTQLFIPKETTLLGDITDTITEFKVNDGTGFPLVARGTSYTDIGSPNVDCGYIQIENEYIRYTGVVATAITDSGTDISFSSGDNSINAAASPSTDLSIFSAGQILTVSGSSSNDGDYVISTVTDSKITVTSSIVTESAGATVGLVASPQFYGCTRGVLNTFPAAHNVDASAGADRRLKVKEYIYIEMPVVKIIYAVLLGSLYNQSGKNFPSHWTASIDTEYVANDDFTGIGDDLWDVNDDTKGVIARFEGLEKVDAKKFIEEQLLRMVGCFMPVYADGSWGLKKRVVIPEDVAPVAILDDSVVISHGGLNYNLEKTRNEIRVEWNYAPLQKAYTRITDVIYATSQSVNQATPVITRRFRGFSGSRHTQEQISRIVDTLADRFANPPIETTVSVLPSLDVLEVGDVVNLNVSDLRDYTKSPVSQVDRSFEVQSISTNLLTGVSSVALMGSSAKEPPQSAYVNTVALDDSFYTSQGGTNINTLGNYTNTGGVGHITDDETLTGGATLSAGIWYHDGDLEVDAGVVLTLTDNVWLLVKGDFTVNGAIDGAGQGRAGATVVDQDVSGYIGAAESGGGILIYSLRFSSLRVRAIRGYRISGAHATPPILVLDYDGSNTLDGLPSDIRGTAGPIGHPLYYWANGNLVPIQTGGNGGKSGAGFCLIARGFNLGAAGSIDLSGGDGSLGGSYDFSALSLTFYAGSGGGGSPGAFYYLADGTNATIPTLTGKFIANQGKTPTQGTRMASTDQKASSSTNYSYYISNGNNTPSRYDASFRTQFIYQNTTAEPDPYELLPELVSGLTFATGTDHLITQVDGTILAAANLSWTPAGDQLVDRYLIWFKKSSASAYNKWQDEPSRSDTETTIYPLEDGVNYDFLVMSHNIYGQDRWSSDTTLTDQTVIGKSANPNPVTGMAIYNRVQSVNVVIEETNMPTDADLASIELWFATVNDRNLVPPINKLTIPCNRGQRWMFPHYAETSTGRYYWARTVDTSGNKSTFYPSSATAGIYAKPKSLFRRQGWNIANASLEEGSKKYSINQTLGVDFKGIFINPDGSKLYLVATTANKVYQFSFAEPWEIDTLYYDNVTFDFSSESTTLQVIHFSPNGAVMYLGGGALSTPGVYEYTLSTSWDISTASSSSPATFFDLSSVIDEFSDFSFSLAGDKLYCNDIEEFGATNYLYQFDLSTSWDLTTATIPSPLEYYDPGFLPGFSPGHVSVGWFDFSSDGRKLYFSSSFVYDLWQVDLSTAWDVTSASNPSPIEGFDVGAEVGQIGNLEVRADGDYMYVVDASESSAGFAQYKLATQGDIASAYYSYFTFDVSAQETDCHSLFFRSDGLKMYLLSDGNGYIYQYQLTEAWNLKTASYENKSYDLFPGATNADSFYFSNDGSILNVLSSTDDKVYQFNFSTNWDVSTISESSPRPTFDVSGEESSPTAMSFSDDGKSMYIVGAGDYIYQYTLISAFDISFGVSLDSPNGFDVSAQVSLVSDMIWRNNGKQFFLFDDTDNKIYSYTVATAWDVRTAAYDGIEFTFSASSLSNNPEGLAFSTNGEFMYIIDDTNDVVVPFSIHTLVENVG